MVLQSHLLWYDTSPSHVYGSLKPVKDPCSWAVPRAAFQPGKGTLGSLAAAQDLWEKVTESSLFYFFPLLRDV